MVAGMAYSSDKMLSWLCNYVTNGGYSPKIVMESQYMLLWTKNFDRLHYSTKPFLP